MENPFQSNLRRPWLLLCATLLLCYVLAPSAPDGALDLDAVGTWVEILMFIFSFPLSLTALLGFHELDLGLTSRLQFWALALALGYFQWFHLVPIFLPRKTAPIVTLNLAAGGGVAPADSAPTPARLAPASLSETGAPPVPQFNERGRTPLERVLDDER